ncbi:MAG: glycosyltransferase, partial [Ignavibacteria bacterium]|nr:glycosyltransferase [Ignavibacteria bacterium]
MRNKIKKISVITLNFNSVESDLHNAITSLINQKFDHEYEVEYILIDDGSKNLNENLVTELLQRVTKAGIQCKFLKNSSNLATVATFN